MLDRVSLMSNSDAHSPNPWRLGREANVLELPELSYNELFDAVKSKDPSRFLYTIEVDPAYGKYHMTGHKKCGISLAPSEALKLSNKCPVCGRNLTVGVLQRVESLADRPEGFTPKGAIPFKKLLPLSEVITRVAGVKSHLAKSVIELQDRLIKAFGSELSVILDATLDDLSSHAPRKISNAIVAVREGTVGFTAGYDGVYGVPNFPMAD